MTRFNWISGDRGILDVYKYSFPIESGGILRYYVNGQFYQLSKNDSKRFRKRIMGLPIYLKKREWVYKQDDKSKEADSVEEEETDSASKEQRDYCSTALFTSMLDDLKEKVEEKNSLDEIIAAFENNCSKYQFEEEMRLYETGVFSFSGSKMFYFSLVRQFPSEEEYIQLNLSALYAPTDQNRKLKEVYWDEDISEDFFHHIRESKAYKSVKNMKIAKVEISLDET